MTHGALFSGSGGFELAAEICGIKTLWNSEIEPFPRRVTKSRFPDTKQLGDIKTIDGGKIDPVDIISGGSPCQDMSVAGRREGLDGSRSTLFHEQIRIIKEMREATDGRYPRYMVWENVPGAFSSNGGEDFRCVLEETISIAEQDVSVPRPSGGKWSGAGEIVGDGYSVAWRVMDAQYWGVPQRRRRIYLVADFAGQSAGKILFERESLHWNFKKSREAWKTYSRKSEKAVDGTSWVVALQYNPTDSRIKVEEDNVVQTLAARMGTGGNNTPLICGTLTAKMAKGTGGPAVGECQNLYVDGCGIRRITPLECARLQGFPDYWTDGLVDGNPSETDVQYWREAWLEWWKSVGAGKGIKKPKDEKAVRRWLASEPSDSDKYKMWGNGIALPCALYVFDGIKEEG